jgi:hypothetical protein
MIAMGLILLCGSVSCRSRTADLGMSDSTFVQVMSDLKAIADEPKLTQEVRAQRREAVYRQSKVTAAQLEALTPALSAHPQHAKRLWTAIDTRASALELKRPKR